ncbi:metal-dependent hydrolase family protein [Brevibacterium antiquum]|uniref:Imidazolonepropionase n=1 Tax=Brevibacterium antiquum TaxID=234835 RepID=A0A2H1KU66_9MICO|nr:amidohydrolase family protein [Brevibacterium antiquum]SMY03199.1 Imidazolonepropionase [Brevibacterium antiquum]
MGNARIPQVPQTDNTTIRLIGARLIDGSGAGPIEDAEIVISGDRISYAGARRTTNDDSETVVDLRGKTVMPGFIDAHVHFGLNIEADVAALHAQQDTERVLDTARVINKTLMAGVTTVRDLAGTDSGYRDAIAAGTILGPRMHLAIMALSPTGGHTDYQLPNGAMALSRLRGFDPIIDTDDDVRIRVRELVRAGADAIKVCTTGGVSSPSDTPDDIGVPEHHVRLIVEEMNKRQGQPVAAHAQGTDGILQALRGGVSSIEHGYAIDAEGLQLAIDQGAFLVPTLSSALRLPSPDDVPDYLYQKKIKWSAIAREHITEALKTDVKVAMGTDSGICPHGRNLTELGHLVELGYTPLKAITAGTKNAATLLRLDKDLGTVEAGKLADLVITDFNPLDDITTLADPDNVPCVIQGGRAVKDRTGIWPSDVVLAGLANN